MAVTSRLTLATLADVIRFHIKQVDKATSRVTDEAAANVHGLYDQIQHYIQNLSKHVAGALQLPLGKRVLLPMYLSRNQSVSTSSGSSTAWLPQDCNWPILLWDSTNSREVDLVHFPSDYDMVALRKMTAGPPKFALGNGFVIDTGDSNKWKKQLTLFPPTVTGVTPSLVVDQYRIPASFTATVAAEDTSYADIDPNYQYAVIWGVISEWLTISHPTYNRFREKELSILQEMGKGATII